MISSIICSKYSYCFTLLLFKTFRTRSVKGISFRFSYKRYDKGTANALAFFKIFLYYPGKISSMLKFLLCYVLCVSYTIPLTINENIIFHPFIQWPFIDSIIYNCYSDTRFHKHHTLSKSTKFILTKCSISFLQSLLYRGSATANPLPICNMSIQFYFNMFFIHFFSFDSTGLFGWCHMPAQGGGKPSIPCTASFLITRSTTFSTFLLTFFILFHLLF